MLQKLLPLLLILAGLGACNKPDPFGSDLLDGDFAEYDFIDTLTLNCSIVPEDSVVTSDENSVATQFPCGELNDPAFGKSSSEIYTPFLPVNSLTDTLSIESKFKLDSIVLYLRYVPSAVYGDTTSDQTIKIHELSEKIYLDSTYYAFNTLAYNPVEVGSKTFKPRPNFRDTLFVAGETAPFLAVRLNDEFGKHLMKLNPEAYSDDSTFLALVKGFRISCTGQGAGPGAMLAFNLNDRNYSILRLYYKKMDTDTTDETFDFSFRGLNKFTRFAHDYSGSTVAPLIGQLSDQLLYLQGMQGLQIKVEVPWAHTLDNIAVNRAALVFTAANIAGDPVSLVPSGQLVHTEKDTKGDFVFTKDVLTSIGGAGNEGFAAFGGSPVEETINGVKVKRYYMNISDRMQEMVDEKTTPLKKSVFYVTVYPQARNASRLIAYGPKNTEFPAFLRLVYTAVK